VEVESESEVAPRRRRNPEATREAILAAARTVLASDGPDGLSLSKVAHLAGVNRGTAYQHFKTREELIKATIDWVSEHLCDTLFKSAEKTGKPPDAAEGAVYDYLIGLADFAVENPKLGRIWLFEMLSCDDPDNDVFFRQFRQSTEALAASEFSEEGIDVEVLSVTILAGYFLWPVWVGARARTKKERRAMSRRMRREQLRSWLYGVLRADAFPELQKLLEA